MKTVNIIRFESVFMGIVLSILPMMIYLTREVFCYRMGDVIIGSHPNQTAFIAFIVVFIIHHHILEKMPRTHMNNTMIFTILSMYSIELYNVIGSKIDTIAMGLLVVVFILMFKNMHTTAVRVLFYLGVIIFSDLGEPEYVLRGIYYR